MGEGEIIKDTFPPSKLGEYTVIQEIAEGTFGKVKSASHTPFLCLERMYIDGGLQWRYTL